MMRCGTDQGESIEYNFSITNSSGKTIKMIPYINGVKDTNYILTLTNGDTLNKKYTYRPPGAAGYSMTQFFPSNTDYVAVVYNNEKINIYSVYSVQCNTCPVISNNSFPIVFNENSRNLFNVNFNDGQIENYTITVDDFQNATDCGGNCY